VVNDEGEAVWTSKAAQPIAVQGEAHWGCPRATIRENPEEWSRILFFYDLFKKGHLPDEGSVASQSNQMMALLRVVENENQDCDAELERRELRKQKGRKR
jgi:hypothetical protein